MRKLFLTLVFLVVFNTAVPVYAQDNVQLSAVSISVWPEYDQAAVLVIYHITLAPETTLPATLNLRVPAQAQVSAVAVLDPVSGLLNAPYKRTVEGKWALLEITANSLQVQVELYDALLKTGTARNIVFEWAGDYALGTIEINFLEPSGSKNVHIVPTPVESALNADGLMNHVIWATELSAGQSFIVTIDYERDTDQLGIASQPVGAVVMPGEDTTGRISMVGTLPWLLAGLGVLLLVAGVVGFFAWQKGEREVSGGHRRHTPRKVRSEEPVYCPQCGKRALTGDAFCRICGARLDMEE
jgi:hypothetical protein